MGHEIQWLDYDYDTKPGVINADGDERARRDGDSDGLPSPMRFERVSPFENRAAAERHIEQVDRAYLSIAVPYYDYDAEKVKEPKALVEARTRAREAVQTHYARESRQYYSSETVKSKTIGCKRCESKLAVAYLRSNNCPLCFADLRPQTELDYLERLNVKAKAAREAEEAEEKKWQEKVRASNKQKTRWLVKIEFHC